MVHLGGFLSPLLPGILPNLLSDKTRSKLAVELIKNNKDLPKSEKDIPIFL